MILSEIEVEKIRLLMSTYQDGTGQLRIGDGTLPNWRDFERSVASALDGIAFESKSFFDVVVDRTERESERIGISCKMRNTLNYFNNKGPISLELSNAYNTFWKELQANKIENIRFVRLVPEKAGKIIVDFYESWKYIAAEKINVNLKKSCYLVCLYDIKTATFQLFSLPVLLPDPTQLTWTVRESKNGDDNRGTLIAMQNERVVIEWYAISGGQLKYYPTIEQVIWKSTPFNLEPLPDIEGGHGIIQKAKAYFPQKWKFM